MIYEERSDVEKFKWTGWHPLQTHVTKNFYLSVLKVILKQLNPSRWKNIELRGLKSPR